MKGYYKYTHGETGITLYIVSNRSSGDTTLLNVRLDDGYGEPAQDDILPLLDADIITDIEIYIDTYLDSIKM